MEGVDVKLVPWDINTQEREIANFDIGVMPLDDSLHSRGKCGYKALQYMAAAVPAVVSDTGINSEIVQHGRLGYATNEIEGFYHALEQLIISPKQRKDKGKASRLHVAEQYSIERISQSLATILKKNLS